jgi:uncharacterized membrane protein
MFQMPPSTPWNALHPSIVHFPIALLLLAPLFIAAAVIWRKHARPLSLVALAVLAAGVCSAQLALMSGEAAEDAVDPLGAAKSLLHEHEEAGELVRNVYFGLAAAFAVVTGALVMRRERCPRLLYPWGALLVLLAMLPCSLLVINTGHLGGRLVHEYGIHAPLGAGPQPVPADRPDHDD